MFYFNYFLDDFLLFSFLSSWNYYFGMFGFSAVRSPLNFLYSLCYPMVFLVSFSSLYNQPFCWIFHFNHIYLVLKPPFCIVLFFFPFGLITVSWVQCRMGKEGWPFWTWVVAILPKMSPLSHLIFTSLCNPLSPLSMCWPSDLLLMYWRGKSDRL